MTEGAGGFEGFPSIARLSRTCVVTEKLDGTNASIWIGEDESFRVASRNRFITPTDDNFGFARWAFDNETALRALGPGTHFGEWWGLGIQRGYGLTEKRFSLFNVGRWADNPALPPCVSLVPILATGDFTTDLVESALADLEDNGSRAAPSFLKPEGIVVYHTASKTLFKKTLDGDGHKGSRR